MIEPYYSQDGITLYCAKAEEVLPQLPEQSVDLIVTDPPYGVGYHYDKHDDTRGKEYERWVREMFPELRRVAKVVMITTGMFNLWLYPKPTWVMCWAKPGSTRRSGLGGFNEWEPVLVYGKRRIYNDFKYLPDCANHSKDTGNHPCPKPLRMVSWLVSEGSDSGALVLDPFAGSGTTLVAAKRLGRRAIGIEISEAYCKIAVQRLSQKELFGIENGQSM
jgi:site-specific DNA-methyltransferase (adenine-specific)